MHYPLSFSLSLSLPLESSSRRLKENSVDCRPCARLNFTPNANIGGHRSFCIMPFLPSLRSSYTRSDSRPRIAITHPHGCRIPFQPTTYDRSQLPWLTPKNPWNRVFTSKGESSIPPLRLRLACARRTPRLSSSPHEFLSNFLPTLITVGMSGILRCVDRVYANFIENPSNKIVALRN